MFLNRWLFSSRMKLSKTRNRFCKFCKKHTEQKVTNQSHRGMNRAHPMSHASKIRVRLRGGNRGFGNQGRYSRKAISKFKMTGKKTSKKTDLRFTCSVCHKATTQREGIRMKRVEFLWFQNNKNPHRSLSKYDALNVRTNRSCSEKHHPLSNVSSV